MYTYIIPVITTIYSFIFSVSGFGTRIGKVGIQFLLLFTSIVNIIFSIYIFFFVNFYKLPSDLLFFSWFKIDIINVYWSVIFDQFSSSMLLLICIVASCAFYFSVEYMKDESSIIRYYSYLSLFTLSMIIVILSENSVQLFVGWEGVGLCSYLLINFWYGRVEANKAAILAVMLNKVGDIAFLLSSAWVIVCFKSADFALIDCIFSSSFGTPSLSFFAFDKYYASTFRICLFVMIAAFCKSAQACLHLWLPEAMEGPTAVSSLIHAATMVTAGIFLINRYAQLFSYVAFFSIILMCFGSITAFFASTIAYMQTDVKKTVAYSTCSQLGYLFFITGSSNELCFFHLQTHGYYKALLFLTVGMIIHANHHDQDSRSVGSLLFLMPFSYIMLLIGSFSLMGITFFSGFYSKEKIIDLLLNWFSFYDLISFRYVFFFQTIALLSTLFTVLYSLKMLNSIYINMFNGIHSFLSIYFSFIYIEEALIYLSIFSTCFGYFISDLMIGIGNIFWNKSLPFSSKEMFRFLNSNLSIDFFDSSYIDYYDVILPFYTEFNQYRHYVLVLLTLSCCFIKWVEWKTISINIYISFFNYQPLYNWVSSKYLFIKRFFVNIVSLFISFFSISVTFRLFDKGIFEVAYSLYNSLVYFSTWSNSSLIYHAFGRFMALILVLCCIFFIWIEWSFYIFSSAI